MRIRIGRALVATLVAEVLGVAILAALVAVFGPPGYEEAMPFATRLGAWVGPISGFVLCIAGGWWTARAAPAADRVVNGAAMGALAAALDLALAAALGTGFEVLLLVSNAGRIIGGTVGGWLASKRG